MNDKTKAVIIRFLKGFIAGGIASIIPMLAVINPKEFMENSSIIVYNLFVAFLSGGLLAIEKSLRWQNPQTPIVYSLPDVPKQSPPPSDLKS